DLEPNDREPEEARYKVEAEAERDPTFRECISGEKCKSDAGDGLDDDGRSREEEIGNDCDTDRAGDRWQIAGPVGHEHEEGNAEARSEQNGGAEHMDELES